MSRCNHTSTVVVAARSNAAKALVLSTASEAVVRFAAHIVDRSKICPFNPSTVLLLQLCTAQLACTGWRWRWWLDDTARKDRAFRVQIPSKATTITVARPERFPCAKDLGFAYGHNRATRCSTHTDPCLPKAGVLHYMRH